MRLFLASLLFLFSAPALAQELYEAPPYVPPTFEQECPSSADRAVPWGAKLLKPDELTGVLAFLNVPYPQRDFLAAQKLFDEQYGYLSSAQKVADDLGAYRETPEQEKISTRYPPGYWEMPWHLIRYYTIGLPTEQVYRFVVDEGCGALTVWRIGVFSRGGRIVDTIVRRTFDDYDFSRRKIPFKIRDFDQQVYLSLKSWVVLDRTLRSLIRGGENQIAILEKILLEAGATGGEQFPLPDRDPNSRTFIFGYEPAYRDRQQRGWVITIRVDVEGTLTQLIASVDPGTLWLP